MVWYLDHRPAAIERRREVEGEAPVAIERYPYHGGRAGGVADEDIVDALAGRHLGVDGMNA